MYLTLSILGKYLSIYLFILFSFYIFIRDGGEFISNFNIFFYEKDFLKGYLFFHAHI